MNLRDFCDSRDIFSAGHFFVGKPSDSEGFATSTVPRSALSKDFDPFMEIAQIDTDGVETLRQDMPLYSWHRDGDSKRPNIHQALRNIGDSGPIQALCTVLFRNPDDSIAAQSWFAYSDYGFVLRSFKNLDRMRLTNEEFKPKRLTAPHPGYLTCYAENFCTDYQLLGRVENMDDYYDMISASIVPTVQPLFERLIAMSTFRLT